MVTPPLPASQAGDIAAFLVSAAAKAAVPTPAAGAGRQRDAVHHLEDLQEGAAHLTGQRPTRGDGADGTGEGGLPHWCSP